jgi:hypothetical protein
MGYCTGETRALHLEWDLYFLGYNIWAFCLHLLGPFSFVSVFDIVISPCIMFLFLGLNKNGIFGVQNLAGKKFVRA